MLKLSIRNKKSSNIRRILYLLDMRVVIAVILWSLIMLSCTKKEQSASDVDDILVTVNDSSLRLREVINQIPIGISVTDSTRLFHAIVNSWIDDRLMESIALDNIDDIDKIDALVADYRRKLIVTAYKRKMRRSVPDKISEDSLKRYYYSHSDELILDNPLVKGIYIKIPEDSPKAAEIKRRLFSATSDDIDYIEKNGVSEAVQYDYFVDKWIEFSSIAEQIPYRFYDPDAFLKSTKNFETIYNGFIYLLYVSEYEPSGSQMPYDFAKRIISDRLADEQFTSFQNQLIKEMRKDALKEGRLKTPGYDIRKRKVTLSNSSPESNLK